MAKGHSKTIFLCQQCGAESPKWLGRCPSCQEWNSFIEALPHPFPEGGAKPIWGGGTPQKLLNLAIDEAQRLTLSWEELNRVLGGGIVPGSVVLLSGDPGIGKSTLLLQMTSLAAKEERRVLYVSGEESLPQIKLRADRLGLGGDNLYLLSETDVEVLLERAEELAPSLIAVDSIQAVYLEPIASPAGSINQVRECTQRLVRWAKGRNVPCFIAGHVTKEGTVAGPKALEHIVDVVLYLEGEPSGSLRLLRSVKNRFGSTNEVGVFEMGHNGLAEVPNPSLALLAERAKGGIGSAIVPTMEGTRPLLVEIQALTNPTPFGLPRRIANGLDYNRLLMISAVLSQRVGLPLAHQDVMVSAVGGLKVSEPAADLTLALAIASSLHQVAVSPDLVALGEVGLSGELRTVRQGERRISEAAKLGFSRCLLPRSMALRTSSSTGMELLGVTTLAEALKQALG
ncbi:MAG: DNA repair protein RadA [Chloroflexi bacterium]|nr:DNA repair protein RadA [Chloroflexota bacterium]